MAKWRQGRRWNFNPFGIHTNELSPTQFYFRIYLYLLLSMNLVNAHVSESSMRENDSSRYIIGALKRIDQQDGGCQWYEFHCRKLTKWNQIVQKKTLSFRSSCLRRCDKENGICNGFSLNRIANFHCFAEQMYCRNKCTENRKLGNDIH